MNYYAVWKLFNKFFIRLDYKPPTWSDRLTLFVAYLIENNKQSATVKSYVSAIKAVLQSYNIKFSQDEFLLNSLTRACRIHNDVVKTHLPVHKGILSIILKRIHKTYTELNQPYLALMFTTFFSTAYFGLFRVSELAKTPSGHAVYTADVQIASNKNKYLFILRTSKTHGEGTPPQLVKISSYSRDTKCTSLSRLPCPYDLLHQFAHTRPPYATDQEQIFVLSDGSPLTASMVRSCFKVALKSEHFNTKLYTLHGIHSGRAVDMLKLGLSVETIKKLGRWKSYAVFKYLKC